MVVKFKKLREGARIPEYATDGAACFDLFWCPDEGDNSDMHVMPQGSSHTVGTGLAVELPPAHVMLVFSRSGQGFKSGVRLANCVGVIDSDYRGEIKVRLHKDVTDKLDRMYIYTRDKAIAQAMVLPLPRVIFEEVDELESSVRNVSGFGSTDRSG